MTVGIRGMGLIGGSFEKAFRTAGHEVLNLKDASSAEIGRCNLIIVCLPPLMVAPWIIEHAKDFAVDALITDAAGVKGVVCPKVEPVAKTAKWSYVGGHPMAGTQFSGFKYSKENMFKSAPMVIVPPRYDDITLFDEIKKLLSPAGFGRITVTTATEHDEMIAYTSQLAHVVSNAYVKSPTVMSHKGFSAGSYKDMTRVAWLNPDMWTELFLENKENLLKELDIFIDNLNMYKDALEREDKDELRELLAEGRRIKEEIDG